PRHTLPPPGINEEAQRAEGFHIGIRRNVSFFTITLVLPPYEIVGFKRAHRPEHLGLFDLYRLVGAIGRGFHGEQAHNLKQVVLNDVAQAAGAFIESAARFDTKGFRQRDLDTVDVIPIPDRLEKRIGEAKIQDVHDRFLAQEVIDAVNGLFWENRAGNAIQVVCGSEVAPERFFKNHAGACRQARGRQTGDYRGKQRRWNGQIMHRPLRLAQGLLQTTENGRVAVV